jgi:hypothetical protein
VDVVLVDAYAADLPDAVIGMVHAHQVQTRRVTLHQAEVVRRLAYIRYLHTLGVGQARRPQPASSAAVLMWHDGECPQV